MTNSRTERMGVLPTTEVMGSLLANQCQKDPELHKQVKDDINSVLLSRFNMDIQGDLTVKVIENSGNDVALLLPYYETGRSADKVDDYDLEDVAGGEILITVFGFIGGAIIAAATGCGIAVGVGTGAAVVAGSAVGGVALGLGVGVSVGAGATVGAATAIGVGVGVTQSDRK